MKKRILSLLLVGACMLTSAFSVTALAAESDVLPTFPDEPTLWLDGEKLIPTAEGTTHTFENGGVATLTTVGKNETGGTDYALTLENIRATKSSHMNMRGDTYAAGLYFISFVTGAEGKLSDVKDTLVITLKGENFISVQGQADETVATALASSCPVSLSGDGTLFLRSAPAQGAETACFGISAVGGIQVGASLTCMVTKGTAVALTGEFSLADGATLRWPTELTQSDRESTPMGVGSRTLMNGESATDMVVVATPSDPVNRGVAVFNLWRMKGSPATKGEYPFADAPVIDFIRDAIHWAGTAGISNGCGNGRFGDMDSITREQFATMVYRLNGSPAVAGDFAADYPYAAGVSSWAKDAVLWSVAQGWTGDPQAILTHGEMDSLVATMSRGN